VVIFAGYICFSPYDEKDQSAGFAGTDDSHCPEDYSGCVYVLGIGHAGAFTRHT